jgi:hypothetical protein
MVAIMPRWFMSCALGALLFGLPVHVNAAAGELRASKPEVKNAVVAVIEAQLAAFRAGDVTKAYSYAATQLRAQTPLRSFVAIVQANYPEIWSNARAEAGIVRDDGERATVLVHIFAKEGDAPFDYVLLKERNGWRIGSVLRHEPRANSDV